MCAGGVPPLTSRPSAAATHVPAASGSSGQVGAPTVTFVFVSEVAFRPVTRRGRFRTIRGRLVPGVGSGAAAEVQGVLGWAGSGGPSGATTARPTSPS
ncbi:hypothetical protein FRAAL3645 [Frankia alni ACN14a]|uniref:Uncharacterized protein n=1 Tax=Frankia alni (strain DSM 45986 / CECT 9034 / ACN14a) TaxID=326424 RepID=Q0RJM4_FRAAA|nr:hypothetical protein FRAAL3645 [Frankia alni ACN14a]